MKKLNIFLFIVTNFIYQSCEKKSQNAYEKPIKKVDSISLKKNISETLIHQKIEKYRIKVEKIDSIQYYSNKENENYKQEEIDKIADFGKAKVLLKDVVYFNYSEEPTDGVNLISKIVFRNSKEFISNDFYSFVAYYPDEDILLTEGGHSTDVSFNLKNGNETELTGNPSYINTSKSKNFRLNGHFNGQECSSYFIQKKMKNEFLKIIQLDEEFEKQTKTWLCIIGDAFWNNDNLLYLSLADSYGRNGKNLGFYKVEIITN